MLCATVVAIDWVQQEMNAFVHAGGRILNADGMDEINLTLLFGPLALT